MSTKLVPLEANALRTDATHRILINFPDDHDINGMKVEIIGVTAEQCAVAIIYIARMADRMIDMREMQAMQEAGQLAGIRDALSRERRT